MLPDWWGYSLALPPALALGMAAARLAAGRAGGAVEQLRRRVEAVEAELARARWAAEALRAELAGLRAAVRGPERGGADPEPPPCYGSVRDQVLLRHGRGETPDAIAALLGLPRGEVTLLLKVNRMLLDSR